MKSTNTVKTLLNKIKEAKKLDDKLRSTVAGIDSLRNDLCKLEKDLSIVGILEVLSIEYPNTANTSRDLRILEAIMKGFYSEAR